MKSLFAAVFCLLSLPLSAAPFAGASAAAGKAIHDKQCVSCHAAKFGGDGSKIYTRAERRMKSAQQLAQQITTCNANLGNKLFPEDERNIGAHLNQQFYKFK
ncbi:MAG: cytochrome c [Hydrogenophilaceae bacterium]|nr:cytochrome c [Hydrogenophilaceae bacterium]